MTTAGYSGTPLAKKLGIKDGFKISLFNAPDHYMQLFADLPPNLYFENGSDDKVDPIHFFDNNGSIFLGWISFRHFAMNSLGKSPDGGHWVP